MFRVILISDVYLSRNVYKEAVVSEAVRAGPVVTGLKERVKELLVEWPDHPCLVQVRTFSNVLLICCVLDLYLFLQYCRDV